MGDMDTGVVVDGVVWGSVVTQHNSSTEGDSGGRD